MRLVNVTPTKWLKLVKRECKKRYKCVEARSLSLWLFTELNVKLLK